MEDILSTLFRENPYLADYTNRFLEGFPEYRQVKEGSFTAWKHLKATLSREQLQLFLEYEQQQNALAAMSMKGYYLFGLGLRDTLREALWADIL